MLYPKLQKQTLKNVQKKVMLYQKIIANFAPNVLKMPYSAFLNTFLTQLLPSKPTKLTTFAPKLFL